jgi:flagellar hook protein FlgE
MSSFAVPLSGLSASETALNVISNNLANMNTVGFKDQTANFQDLFYQNMGTGGNLIQVGGGTSIGSTTSNFTSGTVESTGVASDVAITGNGFFVVDDPITGAQEYTRDGQFSVNASGDLVTAGGQLVMGYPSVNGVVTPSATLSPMQVSMGAVSPASASANISQTTNLDVNSPAGTTYSTTMQVYDSEGESHVLTFNYTMNSAGNWTYQVTLPAADTGGAGAPTVLATGTLQFDSSGNLTAGSTAPIAISINGLADNAAPMNLTWNLTSPSGASLVTQDSSTSGTSATTQDGYPSGTLQSYSVNGNGVIDGQFSNGRSVALGQLVLANFPNQQGLELAGGNTFQATLTSGSPVIGAANSGGLGSLTGGALELSNVDISTEFTELIQVQRSFEADARVITTLDSIGSDTTDLQAAPGN